jgi:hypothetical protein
MKAKTLHIEIPPDIHKQLKGMAGSRGTTIKKVVIGLIEAWLKRNNGKAANA